MKWLGLLGAATLVSIALGTLERPTPRPPAEAEVGEVTRGELIARTVHHGRLESRNVVPVASRLQGTAGVAQLTDEGVRVERGDLLVRFETGDIERDLMKYGTEVSLASAELGKLTSAQHPMELLKLENEIAQTARSLESEQRYLEDSRELARDHLVSEAEVSQQQAKVEGLDDRLRALKETLDLTRAHLHPMEIQRAEARLLAARGELERAKRQIDNGAIFAPVAGILVYQPLHLGGEFRTVRVGDDVYANQPFMMIVDLSDLVVKIAVPEAERGAVDVGNPVLIQPTAFPDLRLSGEVEQVSEIAQSLPDKPSWKRYFRATVGVHDTDPQLRPGMAIVAHVVGYQRADALKIPRRAVRFEAESPLARVVDGDENPLRKLRLGEADETHFEVLGGVEEGERVLLR